MSYRICINKYINVSVWCHWWNTQSFRSFFVLSFIQISAFFCYHEYSFFIVFGIFFELYFMGCMLPVFVCSVPVREWQCEEATYYTSRAPPSTCTRYMRLSAPFICYCCWLLSHPKSKLSTTHFRFPVVPSKHVHIPHIPNEQIAPVICMLCQMRGIHSVKENKSECPTTQATSQNWQKMG